MIATDDRQNLNRNQNLVNNNEVVQVVNNVSDRDNAESAADGHIDDNGED